MLHKVADQAFLFDNSSDAIHQNTSYIGEITGGDTLTFNPDFDGELPVWVEKYLLGHVVKNDWDRISLTPYLFSFYCSCIFIPKTRLLCNPS